MSEKFGYNDLVFIRPSAVDKYFMLERPRGRVVRGLAAGKIKVEIFDTGSQDTEGYNVVGKFAESDLSFTPFPAGE